MAFTDLTAHHSIAPYGGLPTVVETGGPYGGRYIQFDGASALQVANMASFAVSDTEDFCIEVCVRQSGSTGGGLMAVTDDGYPSMVSDTEPGWWRAENVGRFVFSAPAGVGPWNVWSGGDGSYWNDGWQVISLDRVGGLLTYRVDGVEVPIFDGAIDQGVVDWAISLSGDDALRLYIGAAPTANPVSGEHFPLYATDLGLAWVRYTRASRAGTGFASASAPVPIQEADPHWADTALLLVPVDASDLGGSGGGGGGGGGAGGGWQTAVPVRSHDELLRRLLPPTSIDRSGPVIGVEMDAYGAALDLAEAVAGLLLTEMDPRSTAGMLGDWERVYGLDAGTQSAAERRSALLAVILSAGGQSAGFYVQLAAAAGWMATVLEYKPHTVESDVEYPLYGAAWRFIWKVRAHSNAGAIGQAPFEALIRRLAPAHTAVIFEYY